MDNFRYLKVGLSLALLFVSAQLLLARVYPIPTSASIVVIALLLGGPFVASLILRANADGPPTAALDGSARSTVKRLVVAVSGGLVLAVGVAMLVLPGPAFVVIPIGLTILGSEFEWPRRLLSKMRERARRALGKTVEREPRA